MVIRLMWAAAVVLAAGMLGAKTVPPQKTYRKWTRYPADIHLWPDLDYGESHSQEGK